MSTEEKNKPLLLLVDDTPETLTILDELLSEDYRIKVATSGMKCVDLARDSETPDLILLDIMMPVLDGFDTCRLLKADKTTKSIPVIFLTASDDSESEERGLELGGADFIAKPICAPIVKLRIKNLLKMIQMQTKLASYAHMQKKRLQELTENADSGLTLKEQVAFLEDQLNNYKQAYQKFVERHRE